MGTHVLDDVNTLTSRAIIEALDAGDVKIELEIGKTVYGERDGKRVIESCIITGVSIVRAK